MYSKILHYIQQAYYQDNYANDGQRFVAWYLRNIHGLNTVEAKDCITDGANDKQIDAVYINNQDSTIYIIQGKFMSGEYIDAGPVREVLSSWILVQDLDQLQDAANLKLKVKINEISAALDDDYEICFELITTAKLTDQAQMDADAFSKKLSDSEELNANFVVVDNEMLKVKYDEALNKTNNYINFTFQLESGKYLEVELNGIRAVLAAIPLKDCVNIPGIKDGRLFRKNVRQSLGNSNKVNKGIAKTIKKEPGDFLVLISFLVVWFQLIESISKFFYQFFHCFTSSHCHIIFDQHLTNTTISNCFFKHLTIFFSSFHTMTDTIFLGKIV